MKNPIFINESLYQFDISNFEYVGIVNTSGFVFDGQNILMLKSFDDFEKFEVALKFFDRANNKHYYFLIHDFGFIKYSNQLSEKQNLLPIIDEYHEASIIVYNYKNSVKIDVDGDSIQIHHKEGVRICVLSELKELLQKYYPETYTSLIDELDDFSFKMVIKNDNLKNVDESMLSKLSKQFNVKELPNGNKEFYKLKFSYER